MIESKGRRSNEASVGLIWDNREGEVDNSPGLDVSAILDVAIWTLLCRNILSGKTA